MKKKQEVIEEFSNKKNISNSNKAKILNFYLLSKDF